QGALLMRSKSCLILSVILAAVLVAPIGSTTRAQQTPQGIPPAFEPLINRIREALKLNEEQTSDLRKVLIKHGPRLAELRNRAQANPYAPGLQAEVDKELKAIREEIDSFLDEDQKGKFASVDTRPLVPLGQAFVPINISAGVRMDVGAVKLANAERFIAMPSGAAKGRVARLTEEQKLL